MARRMKRANGTGTISNNGKGRRKPWIARACDGNGKYVMVGSFATRREAVDALDNFNAQRRLGLAPPPGAMNVTIGQCWDAWSERELADAGRSKRGNYEAPWKRRIEPLRDRLIRSMGVDDWQALIDADVADGIAGSTTEKLAGTIHAICTYAMERDYIIKDYSQFIKLPPKEPVKEKGSLTHDQITDLVQNADAGDDWATVCVILCYTGWRIEEMLQLRPEDLSDWIMTSGVKTEAGKGRRVPVCTRLRPYVQRWLDKGGEAIICKKDGTRYTAQASRGHIKAALAAVGAAKATPHWCRYTFNTLCHEAGIDALTQKWLAGHSTEADITHHYTKATIQQLVDAVEKLWWP